MDLLSVFENLPKFIYNTLKDAENDVGEDLVDRITTQPALDGDLEFLKKVHEFDNTLINERTWAAAAEGGHIQILEWLKENKISLNNLVFEGAVSGGQIKVLDWAFENRCSWNEDCCLVAASEGNFEVLKWLRAHGCPWDENVILVAFRERHLGIAKWARENGCPIPKKVFLKSDFEDDDPEYQEWGDEHELFCDEQNSSRAESLSSETITGEIFKHETHLGC